LLSITSQERCDQIDAVKRTSENEDRSTNLGLNLPWRASPISEESSEFVHSNCSGTFQYSNRLLVKKTCRHSNLPNVPYYYLALIPYLCQNPHNGRAVAKMPIDDEIQMQLSFDEAETKLLMGMYRIEARQEQI
jgi:hypothetical protein